MNLETRTDWMLMFANALDRLLSKVSSFRHRPGEQRSIVSKASKSARSLEERLAPKPGSIQDRRDAALSDLHGRVVRGMRLFRDLDIDVTSTKDLPRRVFCAGDVVIQEGQRGTSAFVIVEGVALVVRSEGSETRELSRLGPGQIFGEVALIRDSSRTATIVAESRLEVVEVPQPQFLRWVEEFPELADFLGTLQRVYDLSGGERLTSFRGTLDGQACMTTMRGDPNGRHIVATKLIDQDFFTMTTERCSSEPSRARIVFVSESCGVFRRELLLANVVRSESGVVVEGDLVGCSATTIGPDLAHLCQAVSERIRLSSRALARFRRTGHLGGVGTQTDSVCSCLQLGRREIMAAAKGVGRSLGVVQEATGAGVMCGACVPALACLLEVNTAPRCPASDTNQLGEEPDERAGQRGPTFHFDVDALRATRHLPYVQFMSVGSMLSVEAESFMLDVLKELRGSSSDGELAAELDGLIAQESNHVRVHQALNRILLEEVYPRRRTFRRIKKTFDLYHHLPRSVRLATVAAYEYASDCIYRAYLERYYAAGKTLDDDPELDRLLRETGLFDLYQWHASEEFGHREVAFEAMKAAGMPYPVRVLGKMLISAAIWGYCAPALTEFLIFEKTGLSRLVSYAFVRPGAVTGYVRYVLRYSNRGFHPRDLDTREVEEEMRSDLKALWSRQYAAR